MTAILEMRLTGSTGLTAPARVAVAATCDILFNGGERR
jgi:hypothetical protein